MVLALAKEQPQLPQPKDVLSQQGAQNGGCRGSTGLVVKFEILKSWFQLVWSQIYARRSITLQYFEPELCFIEQVAKNIAKPA